MQAKKKKKEKKGTYKIKRDLRDHLNVMWVDLIWILIQSNQMQNT